MGRLKSQMNALDEKNPTVVPTSRLDVYNLGYHLEYLYLSIMSALKIAFIPECQ